MKFEVADIITDFYIPLLVSKWKTRVEYAANVHIRFALHEPRHSLYE